VEELGESIPNDLFEVGDLVAVFGGLGCGACASEATSSHALGQSGPAYLKTAGLHSMSPSLLTGF
jgi:threonine dehydrogenase-like Zn-dependent dehydrogenase